MSQTATADRTQQDWIPEIERSDVAVRLPVNQQFVRDIGVSGSQWRVLVDQIFPAAKSVQAIAMALTYCRTRNLDIFKRPVHIVPMWSSAKGEMVETVWPGISELRTTAARTGEYAGIDEVTFGPEKTITFKDTIEKWTKVEGQARKQKVPTDVEKTVTYPEWASVVIYRMVKGVRCAFHAKVFWREAYATMGTTDVPNEMWTDRPFGQIDKCVEAAALRKAFPEEIGNEYTAEEMHGKALPADVAGSTVARPEPPRPPKPDQAKTPPKPNGHSQKPQPDTRRPANDAPSSLAGKQIEDAEAEELSFQREEGDPGPGEEQEVDQVDDPKADATPSDMLTAMDNAMEKAKTDAEIHEIWNEHDILSRLTHHQNGDEFTAIAKATFARHLKRVTTHGARK
jgi:phage recombination protein Bet